MLWLNGCNLDQPFPSPVPLMGLGQTVPTGAKAFVDEADRMVGAGVPLDAVVAKLAEAFAAIPSAEHPELIKALRLDYADEMIESARRSAPLVKRRAWPVLAAGAAVGLLGLGLLIRGIVKG